MGSLIDEIVQSLGGSESEHFLVGVDENQKFIKVPDVWLLEIYCGIDPVIVGKSDELHW